MPQSGRMEKNMPQKKTAEQYVKSAAKRAVRKKKKKLVRKYPVVAAILFILVLAAYLSLCAIDFYNVDVGFDVDLGEANVFNLFAPKSTIDPLPVPADGEVMFHFIDVGQGDAILITTPEGNMLVDTSESAAEEQLGDYLDAAGITTLKYLVLSHLDADHIGNATFVIKNYKVETVVFGEDDVATTNLAKELMTVMGEKDIQVLKLKMGDSFTLGALKNTVIAPSEDYGDANENSLVIKATYGETSVMLTGDAEKKSEGDIVENWSKDALKSDILKVGHHGSESSTTDKFLNAVAPKIAVISCGEGNKFDHPRPEVLERLEKMGVIIYRTDIDGSIIFKTDGKEITLVETRKDAK